MNIVRQNQKPAVKRFETRADDISSIYRVKIIYVVRHLLCSVLHANYSTAFRSSSIYELSKTICSEIY